MQGPKPSIASKPKYVPPVNIKTQRDPTRVIKRNPSQKKESKDSTQNERNVEKSSVQMESFQSYVHVQRPTNFPSSIVDPYIKDQAVSYMYCCERTSCETQTKKTEEDHPSCQKGPNSPSTVCCSILSNAGNDCCGVILNTTAKKELNGKSLTKMESVDSNSSDSGGFKDFVQLDLNKSEQALSHHRKVSQPELQEKTPKPYTHQRNSSQPEYTSQESRQTSCHVKSASSYVTNAQALAQYLPQAEQKFLGKSGVDRSDETRPQKLSVAQTSQLFIEKTEDTKSTTSKPRQPLISQGQFQQSTRKIEELLSQRLEKEKMLRKNVLIDGEASQEIEQKMMVQRQLHQKLHSDLQQTVKQIQEIQSIELRLPQNRKWCEVIYISKTYFIVTMAYRKFNRMCGYIILGFPR